MSNSDTSGKTISGKTIFADKYADNIAYKEFTADDHANAADWHNERRNYYMCLWDSKDGDFQDWKKSKEAKEGEKKHQDIMNGHLELAKKKKGKNFTAKEIAIREKYYKNIELGTQENFVNESKKLRTNLIECFFSEPNPVEMRKIKPDECMQGTGFFPIGDGIYKHGENSTGKFPDKGIMVLGQDFSNEDYLINKLSKTNIEGETNRPGTWSGIKKIFWKDAGIPLEKCFFTNIYTGIRPGCTKMTDPVFKQPTKKKPESNLVTNYKSGSFDFLKLQIQVQKPKLIICMGKEVFTFLGKFVVPQLSEWKDISKYEELKNKNFYINATIDLPNGNKFTTLFVAIIHPSQYNPNKKYYPVYKGKTGKEDSMIDVLKDAVSKSQVLCNP